VQLVLVFILSSMNTLHLVGTNEPDSFSLISQYKHQLRSATAAPPPSRAPGGGGAGAGGGGGGGGGGGAAAGR